MVFAVNWLSFVEEVYVRMIGANELPDADYKWVKCNLYGSDDASLYAVASAGQNDLIHRTRVRCRKCGLVYSNPQATAKRLSEFYSRSYATSSLIADDRLCRLRWKLTSLAV